MLEEDNGQWGALVVLASKPHQENVSWHEYQWRLCVSYQKQNQVTRPFTFFISCCDDTVQDIDTEANYFIAVDMDSGYWQVVEEEESHKRLSFFTPDGKCRWNVMPMGDLNAAPTFLATMMNLHMEWYTPDKEHGLTNVTSKMVVDDVLLYGRTSMHFLDYLKTVMDFLKYHRATLKLKKCKWFQDRCEFVGMDIPEGGTQPVQSKNEAFAKLERLITWGDLRMIIGIFGFYSQFFPLYELDIRTWRYILSKQPQLVTLYQKD